MGKPGAKAGKGSKKAAAPPEPVETEEGTFVFPDGGKYVGIYRTTTAGIIVRHDRGVMKFASGQIYDGQWEDDTMAGHGVLTFPDGSCYQGGFKAGKFNGEGVYTFANGSKVAGVFQDSRPVGEALFEDEDKSQWKGTLSDDCNGMFKPCLN
eukprot:m.34025 g.34025  ORF g.34025 m.34025 type:complete len:152 (-) comp9722_c0_seq1:233-688(-)